MKKSLTLIFILLNIDLFISDDDHCKDYDYSLDDNDNRIYYCIKCDDGYYLEKDICYKNLCVEGEKEDSCSECKSDGRCYSCYSDDYMFMRDINVKKLFCNVEIIQLKIVKNVKLLMVIKLVFVSNVILNI